MRNNRHNPGSNDAGGTSDSEEFVEPSVDDIEVIIIDQLASIDNKSFFRSYLPTLIAKAIGIKSQGHLPPIPSKNILDAIGNLESAGILAENDSTSNAVCLVADYRDRFSFHRAARRDKDIFRLKRTSKQGELKVIERTVSSAATQDENNDSPSSDEIETPDIFSILNKRPDNVDIPAHNSSSSRLDLSKILAKEEIEDDPVFDGQRGIPPLAPVVEYQEVDQPIAAPPPTEMPQQLDQNHNPNPGVSGLRDELEKLLRAEKDLEVFNKLGIMHVVFSVPVKAGQGRVSHIIESEIFQSSSLSCWRIHASLPYYLETAAVPILSYLSQDSHLSSLRIINGVDGTSFVLRHDIYSNDPRILFRDILMVLREAEQASYIIANSK